MTWAEVHGTRPLLYRRFVKATLCSRIADVNGAGGMLGETTDGFSFYGGPVDFEFTAPDGYALAARLANSDRERSSDTYHEIRQEMIEDARDYGEAA